MLLDVVALKLSTFVSAAPEAGPADRSATDGTPAAAHACPECGHDGSTSCTSCPICRLLSVLRGERPEVTAKLAEGALQVIGSLRTLLGNQAGHPSGESDGDRDPGEPTGRSEPKPHTVQHFDVG